MSLFKGLKGALFVEETPEEKLGGDLRHRDLDDMDLEEDDVSVEIPDNEQEDGQSFIDAVYEANDMSNKDRSIYMVDVYMQTLPAEMLSAKKAETVIKVLSASKITKDEVLTDGENRIEILQRVNNEIISEETEKINAANAEIERLKGLIDAQEQIINASNKKMQDIDGYIETEVKFIDTLIKSISLDNGGK